MEKVPVDVRAFSFVCLKNVTNSNIYWFERITGEENYSNKLLEGNSVHKRTGHDRLTYVYRLCYDSSMKGEIDILCHMKGNEALYTIIFLSPSPTAQGPSST